MTDELTLRMIQLFLIFLIFWTMGDILADAKRYGTNLKEKFWTGLWIGYVADLLDTLGIGTFATSTVLSRVTKLAGDDKKTPAILPTTYIILVLVKALCFITTVEVDLATLFAMAMASLLGAFIGTRITRNWNTRQAQHILGVLLIVATFIMVHRLIANPGTSISESAHDLHGIWTPVGMMFNSTVDILATMGLGNYVPELIFFSILGTNPSVAPSVMVLDATVITSASTTGFIKSGRVSWPDVLGIIIGGSFDVLTAVFLLNKFDINHFKILIVFITLFTGANLLRSPATRH